MSTTRTANLLGALAGAVVDEYRAPLTAPPNRNTTSAAALKLIGDADGCSNRELSQALDLTHPATVRLVDRLVDAGLVERRAGTDRRAVALRLTDAGGRRVRALLALLAGALDAIVDVLPAEQRRQLDRIAETLLRTMTGSPLGGARICRLCDEQACPPGRCPVHLRAHELLDEASP